MTELHLLSTSAKKIQMIKKNKAIDFQNTNIPTQTVDQESIMGLCCCMVGD